MPETMGVTLRFRMQGYEEMQRQLSDLNTAFGDFWARMDREAKQSEWNIKMSMSRAVYSLSVATNLGISVMDALGIGISTALKALIQTMMSYVMQLQLIATAQLSAGNAAGATILSSLAMTLQLKGVVEAERMERDAQASLTAGRAALERAATLIRLVQET